MLLNTSFKRRLAATIGAAVGFILLYEARAFDARYLARLVEPARLSSPIEPGSRVTFYATAYCKGTTTASGIRARTGIAAADPAVLPNGSVVEIGSLEAKYNGVYTVMDNGPAVRGRELDLYMWSCHEALRFGRRRVSVRVLRVGWNPNNTVLRPGTSAPPPLESRPLPRIETIPQ
jgi:3D (Asp-Asp-Asp) domain-containing protein